MEYMNSSPVMTMILQPEFSPSPPRPISYMISQPPPAPIKRFRTRDKAINYPPPQRSSGYSNSASSNSPYVVSRRPHNQASQTPWNVHQEPTKRTPRIIRRPASSDSSARYSSARRAPYAPRMMDTSRMSAMQPYPAAPNNPRIPEYDSIGDPYMMDFYAKKYGLQPQPPRRMERSWSAPGHGMRSSLPEGIKSYRFGSARARRSESYSSSRHRKKGIGQEIEYKITVKTGTKLNCGTDARVFIRMFGRRGRTQKMRLFKKSGQSNIKMFRFAKGSSHTFKIRAPDVGELKSIVIEHDGLEARHSWFLEEVGITRRERSYAFICERWFSLFKGDCQLSRELNAVSGKQGRKIDYEITTVTGDKRGAGTDAHVFVTIHGSKGSTPRLQLRNDSYNTFERGKSDVFLLRTVNVGKIRKVRIEIDNQGFAPAWYLERVVILASTQRMHFPCGEWLSDDDQLYRDLMGSEDPSGVGKSNIYTVTVFTGDVRGAGTDSNVFVTIFGDLGDSGQKILDDNRNNFERGKKDVFKIKCPNVGKLKKIRIGHDNSGASSGWFLEKIAIDDSSTGRVYTFPCGRWFAKDEDDGRITRELIAGKGDAGIPYTIKIFTGDVRGAATSANVYIILYGGKRGEQNTGKIQLQGKFERNRQDICHVESASMLSPLDKIEIGHDNSGAGAGWFVDKVIVVCNSTGCEQVFSCSKWFATDEGDGLISRELYETKSLRKQVVQKTAWNCTIWTTDMRNAGTDAKVFLQIYGDKGKSDEIPIKNESDNFETGQKDTFKIDFVNVGTVYKLRVWHDNSRSFPGWHLDKIVFEPVGGKKKENYTFNCGKWLDESEGDCEIIRELPASGPLVRKPQPLVRYIVSVTTGDKRNAATDANVFLCLFGGQGDTGNRPLQRSKSNRNKFERKNVDEFVIEAVTLKELTKVRIGHDDSGPGSGWFLEKVEAWEEGKGIKTVFPCGRWLATDEDDGLIIRELTPEGTPQLLNTTTYHVSVKTGDVSGAGTDADVFIKIFGSAGDTGRLKLHQGENIRNKFERGRTDMFKLEATDIGRLERIILGHDDSGIGAGWFLDGVEIDVPSSGMHYTFNCHRWLATDEEDGKTTVELYPTQTRQQDKLLPYEITVKTGDKLNSGTNANVTLQIYGEDGKSEVLQLGNRTDNFERDATDKFKVEAQDVGPITKIRLGHDGKGTGPGWFVDQVTIQRFVKRTSKRKKKRRESLSPDRGDVETYWFVCQRWFDKDEDDGQIIRELVPTDESGRPIDEALQEKEYSVHVFTGDKLGAGTDADVFMTLYGDTGDSGERKLAKSETNMNKFERNQEDIFKIRAADLGGLKKMKIRRDDAIVGAAWYLDRVEVRSVDSHLIFPCQRWLSTKEDDGQIERVLVPVSQEIYQRLQSQDKKKSKVRDAIALETKAQLTTYEVTVKTGDVWSGGTDANVYMIMYGENDDSGKINLKSSKTYRDKFERDHADVFTVESADLGNLKKIKIGHDNSGIGAGWYLEYVDIDAPSMGLKWHFPCGRWVDKDRDDGLLDRDLYPSDHGTMEYMAKVPYEISVTTSDISGAGSDADVYIVLYGRDGVATEQASLCPNKDDRKSKYFKRKATDTFVLELDDIGETIEKLRIGHNGKGFGAGWHLDKVQIRRLLDGAKGSETYFFNCSRWLARDEDDGQIVRELVPVKKFEDKISRSGKLKRMESTLSDTLKSEDTYFSEKSSSSSSDNDDSSDSGDDSSVIEEEIINESAEFQAESANIIDDSTQNEKKIIFESAQIQDESAVFYENEMQLVKIKNPVCDDSEFEDKSAKVMTESAEDTDSASDSEEIEEEIFDDVGVEGGRDGNLHVSAQDEDSVTMEAVQDLQEIMNEASVQDTVENLCREVKIPDSAETSTDQANKEDDSAVIDRESAQNYDLEQNLDDESAEFKHMSPSESDSVASKSSHQSAEQEVGKNVHGTSQNYNNEMEISQKLDDVRSALLGVGNTLQSVISFQPDEDSLLIQEEEVIPQNNEVLKLDPEMGPQEAEKQSTEIRDSEHETINTDDDLSQKDIGPSEFCADSAKNIPGSSDDSTKILDDSTKITLGDPDLADENSSSHELKSQENHEDHPSKPMDDSSNIMEDSTKIILGVPNLADKSSFSHELKSQETHEEHPSKPMDDSSNIMDDSPKTILGDTDLADANSSSHELKSQENHEEHPSKPMDDSSKILDGSAKTTFEVPGLAEENSSSHEPKSLENHELSQKKEEPEGVQAKILESDIPNMSSDSEVSVVVSGVPLHKA